MKTISLTQGKHALVDDEDFEVLNKFKWYFNGGYAVRGIYLGGGRKNQKMKIVLMHSLINNTPHGFVTDHINGNKLDNQKENLRVATKSQNRMNSEGYKRNRSGLKGSHWNIHAKKWESKIGSNGKRIHLGYFNSEEEAAISYNKAARQYHGQFARLNIL